MKTILILSSDSRESANKAKQFVNAASHKNIKTILATTKKVDELTNLGDQQFLIDDTLISKLSNVVAVISCSDGLASLANEIRYSLGIVGKPIADYTASKLSSAILLKNAGFEMIPTQRVHQLEDIESSFIDGPVFVKPELSSGVSSQVPWGYKMFESSKHFLDYLIENGYSESFKFSEPVVMSKYIPHDGMHCISAILRDGKASCFGHSFVKVTGSDYFYDYVHYSSEYGTDVLEPMIEKLWGLGFTNNFFYLQCLKDGDKLYPIDLNTRLSTYLDTMATYFDPDFYSKVLDFILGNSDSVDIIYPAKHTLIGRIKSDPHKPVVSIDWENVDGVKPLNFSGLTKSRAFYDKAYSWATFACLADSHDEVMDMRERFVSGVKVKQ